MSEACKHERWGFAGSVYDGDDNDLGTVQWCADCGALKDENGAITLPASAPLPPIYAGNPQFEPLRQDATMEALRDRTVKVDVPPLYRKGAVIRAPGGKSGGKDDPALDPKERFRRGGVDITVPDKAAAEPPPMLAATFMNLAYEYAELVRDRPLDGERYRDSAKWFRERGGDLLGYGEWIGVVYCADRTTLELRLSDAYLSSPDWE